MNARRALFLANRCATGIRKAVCGLLFRSPSCGSVDGKPRFSTDFEPDFVRCKDPRGYAKSTIRPIDFVVLRLGEIGPARR
jgi:hypothetical protein